MTSASASSGRSNIPRMTEETADARGDEDSTALLSMARMVWEERRAIALTVAGVLVVLLIAGPIVLWQQPAERTASLPFRLVFPSSERDQYPNGSAFSRADLVSNAVLSEVYESNALDRYLPFEVFRRGLFVLASSTDIALLELQYRAKLSETPLPAPERSRLEAEFRQKRESMPTPELSLHLVLPTTVATVPDVVMKKVLNDTLAVWAEQAARDKGALGYSTALLTPGVLAVEPPGRATGLIRYDQLRRNAARVLQQIDRLTTLPGAATLRVGADRLTLLDLRVQVEDLLRFDVLPALERRLATIQTSDEIALNSAYLRDRLSELQRALDGANGRRAQVQQALATFEQGPGGPDLPNSPSGASPGDAGLPESFLDSVIALASRSGAVDYRKALTDQELAFGRQALDIQDEIAFYTSTLRQLTGSPGRGGAGAPREEIEASFDASKARVLSVLGLTHEVYEKISELNLNPRGSLYEVTGPFSVSTVRPMSERWLLQVGAFLLVVSAILASIFFVVLRMSRRSASQ